MTHLLSRPDYEQWLYAIPVTCPSIRSSTLHFFTTSATIGVVSGTVFFDSGYELRVSELVDFAAGDILDYGYPDNPTLANTYPHHKHVPPDIKHNRIPAPGLSFTQPNLPLLIKEIERELPAAI